MECCYSVLPDRPAWTGGKENKAAPASPERGGATDGWVRSRGYRIVRGSRAAGAKAQALGPWRRNPALKPRGTAKAKRRLGYDAPWWRAAGSTAPVGVNAACGTDREGFGFRNANVRVRRNDVHRAGDVAHLNPSP